MNIHILEGNFERAKEVGSKLVSLTGRSGQGTNDEADAASGSCEMNPSSGYEQQTWANSTSSDQNDNELMIEQLNIRFAF